MKITTNLLVYTGKAGTGRFYLIRYNVGVTGTLLHILQRKQISLLKNISLIAILGFGAGLKVKGSFWVLEMYLAWESTSTLSHTPRAFCRGATVEERKPLPSKSWVLRKASATYKSDYGRLWIFKRTESFRAYTALGIDVCIAWW